MYTLFFFVCCVFFCFQAEDGIRDLVRSRGLGDVYKRQIWGVAWNKREKALYSSAFIKQYGDLTAHGHDAIFKTSIPEVGMPSTTLFAKLSSLGPVSYTHLTLPTSDLV